MIHIRHGRNETIFDPKTRTLRQMMDGRGLIDTYSNEELIMLSRAFWNAVPIEARRAETTKIGRLYTLHTQRILLGESH